MIELLYIMKFVCISKPKLNVVSWATVYVSASLIHCRKRPHRRLFTVSYSEPWQIIVYLTSKDYNDGRAARPHSVTSVRDYSQVTYLDPYEPLSWLTCPHLPSPSFPLRTLVWCRSAAPELNSHNRLFCKCNKTCHHMISWCTKQVYI